MSTTATDCVDCIANLDHCHGTLVMHHDQILECTDAGCTQFDVVRHALIIDCDEIAPACGCGDDAPEVGAVG